VRRHQRQVVQGLLQWPPWLVCCLPEDDQGLTTYKTAWTRGDWHLEPMLQLRCVQLHCRSGCQCDDCVPTQRCEQPPWKLRQSRSAEIVKDTLGSRMMLVARNTIQCC
jgi:hypothetical protein